MELISLQVRAFIGSELSGLAMGGLRLPKCRGVVLRVTIISCATFLAGCADLTDEAQVFAKSSKRLSGSQSLSIENASLSIGEIWPSRKFPWQVVVTNSSNDLVDVERITTSCSCTNVTPSGFILQPDESVTIQLTINTEKNLSESVLQTPFSVELNFRFRGGRRVETFLVTGSVQRPFTVPFRQYQFPMPLKIDEPPEPVEVTFQRHPQVQELQVACEGDLLHAEQISSTDSDETWRFEIGPQSRIGNFKFSAKIEGELESGVGQHTETIVLIGSVEGTVSAQPRNVLIQSDGANFPINEVVRMESSNGQRFKIVDIRPSNQRLKCEVKQADTLIIFAEMNVSLLTQKDDTAAATSAETIEIEVLIEGSAKPIIVPVKVTIIEIRRLSD